MGVWAAPIIEGGDEPFAPIIWFDISRGVIPTASLLEYFSAEKSIVLDCAVMAEDHCKEVVVKSETDCIVEDCEKIGARMGSHVANFANGVKTFTRTVDHASTGHGIGVTTVAFVYD